MSTKWQCVISLLVTHWKIEDLAGSLFARPDFPNMISHHSPGGNVDGGKKTFSSFYSLKINVITIALKVTQLYTVIVLIRLWNDCLNFVFMISCLILNLLYINPVAFIHTLCSSVFCFFFGAGEVIIDLHEPKLKACLVLSECQKERTKKKTLTTAWTSMIHQMMEMTWGLYSPIGNRLHPWQ